MRKWASDYMRRGETMPLPDRGQRAASGRKPRSPRTHMRVEDTTSATAEQRVHWSAPRPFIRCINIHLKHVRAPSRPKITVGAHLMAYPDSSFTQIGGSGPALAGLKIGNESGSS